MITLHRKLRERMASLISNDSVKSKHKQNIMKNWCDAIVSTLTNQGDGLIGFQYTYIPICVLANLVWASVGIWRQRYRT